MQIDNVMLATAYVPFQKIDKILPNMEALEAGTIFPELVRPYKPQKREDSYDD